ncbi:hypothetical protein RFI_15588 [Reticulomyxa filosa]|uniref:Uncharacterized protein n=1 Tax=Reticulomyxa filosa TaxID=46433 RepID=X6N781_RETFI|nr:hypothetical protein RFI_15588 [Reticulomyxa filosa]|eukprot:ETO21614.1 hypothetical protein RFI_15588 [Reticulomyxa filosa]
MKERLTTMEKKNRMLQKQLEAKTSADKEMDDAKSMQSGTNDAFSNMISIWQSKQRKLYQQIDHLRKELESVQTQKLALDLANQKLRHAVSAEQDLNNTIGDHVNQAHANCKLLQALVKCIRDRCVRTSKWQSNALSTYVFHLESELFALANVLNAIALEKVKTTGSRRCLTLFSSQMSDTPIANPCPKPRGASNGHDTTRPTQVATMRPKGVLRISLPKPTHGGSDTGIDLGVNANVDTNNDCPNAHALPSRTLVSRDKCNGHSRKPIAKGSPLPPSRHSVSDHYSRALLRPGKVEAASERVSSFLGTGKSASIHKKTVESNFILTSTYSYITYTYICIYIMRLCNWMERQLSWNH